MGKDSEFLRGTATAPSLRLWHQLEDRSDVLLSREIQHCREMTKLELYLLSQTQSNNNRSTASSSTSSNIEYIRRIIYVFHQDLLASPTAAMILEKKSLRDRFYCDGTSFPAYNYHIITGRKLKTWEIMLITIVLAGLIVVMLGYILIFAQLYPSQLQRAWLYSLYTFLGFDMIFISTLEVFIQHITIPYYIKSDLHIASKVIMQLIPAYTEKIQHNHAVRTASIDPIQVLNGKSMNNINTTTSITTTTNNNNAEKERILHNITDLFFVTARIAEHEYDTAISRFLHTYTTMLPPVELFSRPKWYRPLTLSLRKATKKFKNPTLYTQTLGYGYRTIFHLDLITNIINMVIVTYIYAPIWLQDVLLQCILVVTVGAFLLLMYALYEIEASLVILPPIVLGILICVYNFYHLIRECCWYCFGASNRVRPAQLPVSTIDLDSNNDGMQSKRKPRSKQASQVSVEVEELSALEDVESGMASSGKNLAPLSAAAAAALAGSPVAHNTTTAILLGQPVAATPERLPKKLPQQSSPHPAALSQFFPESDSEVEGVDTVAPVHTAYPTITSSVLESDEEKEMEESAQPVSAAPSPEEKVDSSDESAEAKSERSSASLPVPTTTAPTVHIHDTGKDDMYIKDQQHMPVVATPSAAPVDLNNAEASGNEGSDEWEPSHSDDELNDLPAHSREQFMRSFSSKAGGDAVHRSFSASGPLPTTTSTTSAGGGDGSPEHPPRPSFHIQNLFSNSGHSLHSLHSMHSLHHLPTTSTASTAVAATADAPTALPNVLATQSMASEEDDSDYEEYGSDDVDRESVDDPVDQLDTHY